MKGRLAWPRFLVCFLACFLVGALGLGALPAKAEKLVLWHSYRGEEEKALTQIIDAFEKDQANGPDTTVEVLAIPHEVMASKISTAVPRGNGPDLFIFAHERLGGWAETGIVADNAGMSAAGDADFFPETVQALTYDGRRFGFPLGTKSVALFFNRALVPEAPKSTDALIRLGERKRPEGSFLLAYPADNFYFHAPFFFGHGAPLLDDAGRVNFETPEHAASLAFVAGLTQAGLIPEEPTGALVTQLFNDGKADLVISGPWFLGEIDKGVDFGVAPLPRVDSTGLLASPFLTVEAVFVSGQSTKRQSAFRLAEHLAGKEAALQRAVVGRQVVATQSAWTDARLQEDPVLSAFRAQAASATPMDNRPAMRDVWEPGNLALKKVLRGGITPEKATRAAQRRYAATTRVMPEAANPTLYVLAGLLGTLALLFFAFRRLFPALRKADRGALMRGWLWVSPAMVVTAILIFLPFIVGLALSLFAHKQGDYRFVGLANFIDILSARHYGPMEPLSFYYAFFVTVLWTGLNLVLHVGIGLGLALLLNRPLLRLKPIYRVILILPWAVPNYITALMWKGLFHKQFGAINAILEGLGIEGISWFSSFWTAFFANLSTNAWLGFPFMMVVCLGALQSIPSDLYEAASIDGAGRAAQFRHITLPLLRPALIPAVLLGTVWTFNQFNIVYLVSGGEPDNATDILISEAWRWAFARQEQYGYAAAYAALIFVILLGWSLISTRINRLVEEQL
jgi:arabinogalactan oligomer/maltooligosaccharide transport system permease protein